MDPVRAIRTLATYLAAIPSKSKTGVVVTGECYHLVPISHVGQAKYVGVMTTSIYFPGPRGGLDEGSLAELALDCRDIEIHVAKPRPWIAPGVGPIAVPDDASALVDGLAAYGS